jgi:hypothetical protein
MTSLIVLKVFNFLLNVGWKAVVVAIAFSVSSTLGWVAVGILGGQLLTQFLIERELSRLETEAMSKFVDQYLTKAIGGGNA